MRCTEPAAHTYRYLAGGEDGPLLAHVFCDEHWRGLRNGEPFRYHEFDPEFDRSYGTTIYMGQDVFADGTRLLLSPPDEPIMVGGSDVVRVDGPWQSTNYGILGLMLEDGTGHHQRLRLGIRRDQAAMLHKALDRLGFGQVEVPVPGMDPDD